MDNTVKIGQCKKRRKYDFPSVGGGSRLWPSTEIITRFVERRRLSGKKLADI